VILLLFYFLSFWPLLVNNGIFWDDWVLYHQTPQTLTDLFGEAGSPPSAYFIRILVSVAPVFGKWFVFAVYLGAMLVVYQILQDTKLFGKEESLLLTLLSAVIPFNFARIASVDAMYAVCYLLFLLAFLALVKYMSGKRRRFRIVSLLLFFLSFGASSLLVFYVVALLYIGYCRRTSLGSLRGIVRTCVAHLDFLLIPVVFFAMKSLFFVPYGIYAGHNKISLDNIARSPREFLLTLGSSFADVIGRSLIGAAGAVGISALLLLVAYLALAGRVCEGARDVDAYRIRAWRFALGAFLFYAGLLPYLAIGRRGATFGSEWESRDQLLLGIGAAFLLYYGLKYLFTRVHLGAGPQRLVFAVLVAAFVLANMGMYVRFQADWFKEVAFIENVKAIPVIRDNTTFAVVDRAASLNAMNRHIQFYEYNGMLRQAFGTTTRLAAPSVDIGVFANPAFLAMCVERPQYNFRNYVYSAPAHTIFIDPGTRTLGLASMARLLAEEVFKPAAFRADVKNIIDVTVEPAKQTAVPSP